MALLLGPLGIVVLIVALLCAHAALLLSIAAALVLPNPMRAWRRHPGPEAFGLQAEPLRLASGEPGWWVAHPTSRRVVVVCHGRSRSSRWMLPAVARLARSVNVLAFDFKGHGGNRWARTTLGDREADAVHAAIDVAEGRGFDDIVVYGTSMGGAAAILALGRRQRASVRGLVTDGTFDRLQRVIDGIAVRLPLPRFVARQGMGMVPRVGGFVPTAVAPVEVVGRIGVPCLFLHGDHDPLVPTEASQFLQAASGGFGRAQIYPGRHDEPDNPAMQDALEAFVVGLPSVPSTVGGDGAAD